MPCTLSGKQFQFQTLVARTSSDCGDLINLRDYSHISRDTQSIMIQRSFAIGAARLRQFGVYRVYIESLSPFLFNYIIKRNSRFAAAREKHGSSKSRLQKRGRRKHDEKAAMTTGAMTMRRADPRSRGVILPFLLLA